MRCAPTPLRALLQLGVLGLGLLQDWDVGVGVFPLGEEILVGGACFGRVTLQSVGASKTESGQGCVGRSTDGRLVIENFLKLGSGLWALFELDIGQAAQVGGDARSNVAEVVRLDSL